MLEWIEYHRVVHSVGHFYLYDSGAVDDEMRAKLAPLLKAGVVTITDLRATLLFSLYYKGQVGGWRGGEISYTSTLLSL